MLFILEKHSIPYWCSTESSTVRRGRQDYPKYIKCKLHSDKARGTNCSSYTEIPIFCVLAHLLKYAITLCNSSEMAIPQLKPHWRNKRCRYHNAKREEHTLSKVMTGVAEPIAPSFFFSILYTTILFSLTLCTINALESGLQATCDAQSKSMLTRRFLCSFALRSLTSQRITEPSVGKIYSKKKAYSKFMLYLTATTLL